MTPAPKGTPKSTPWSAEEDQLLHEWQGVLGNKWSLVAQHIPGRTGQQCAQRWRHKVNPDIVHAPWTEEEDTLLLALVNELGQHWAAIARRIPGRTDQQCLGRWRRRLDPSICRGEWTPEEDALLMSVHAQLGNSWSQICRIITGRTSQQCRGRFFQICAKDEAPKPRRPSSGKTSQRVSSRNSPVSNAYRTPFALTQGAQAHSRHARPSTDMPGSPPSDYHSVQGFDEDSDENDANLENQQLNTAVGRHPGSKGAKHCRVRQSDSKPLRCSESPVGSGGSECEGDAADAALEDGDENETEADRYNKLSMPPPEQSSCGGPSRLQRRINPAGSQATSLPTEGGAQTTATTSLGFLPPYKQPVPASSSVRRGGRTHSGYRAAVSERSDRTQMPQPLPGPAASVYATPCNLQQHRPVFDHWAMGLPPSMAPFNTTVIKTGKEPEEGDEAALTQGGVPSSSAVKVLSSRARTATVRRPRCSAFLLKSLSRRLPAGPGAMNPWAHMPEEDEAEEDAELVDDECALEEGNRLHGCDMLFMNPAATESGVLVPPEGQVDRALHGRLVPLLPLQQLVPCQAPVLPGARTPASARAAGADTEAAPLGTSSLPVSAKRKTMEGFIPTPGTQDPLPLPALMQARWTGSTNTPRTPRPPPLTGVSLCLDPVGSGTKMRQLSIPASHPIAIVGCALECDLADLPPSAQDLNGMPLPGGGAHDEHDDGAMLTHPSGHTTPDSIVRMLHSPPAPCDLQNTMTCGAGDSLFGAHRHTLGPTSFTGAGRPATMPLLHPMTTVAGAAVPADAAGTASTPRAGASGTACAPWVLQTPMDAQCASPPAAQPAGVAQDAVQVPGMVGELVTSPPQQSVSQWSQVPALSWSSFQEQRNKLKDLQAAVEQGLQPAPGCTSAEPTPISNHTQSRLAVEVGEEQQGGVDTSHTTPATGGRTSGYKTTGRASRCASPLIMAAAVDLESAFAAQQGGEQGDTQPVARHSTAAAGTGVRAVPRTCAGALVNSLPSSIESARGIWGAAAAQPVPSLVGTPPAGAALQAVDRRPAVQVTVTESDVGEPQRVLLGFKVLPTAPSVVPVEWPQSLGPATSNYLAGPGARSKNKHQGSPSKKLRVSTETLCTSGCASENEHPNAARPRSVGASPADASKKPPAGLSSKHLRTSSLGATGQLSSGPASPVLHRIKSVELGAAATEGTVHGPLLAGTRRPCVPGYPGYGSVTQCQSLLAGFVRSASERQETSAPSSFLHPRTMLRTATSQPVSAPGSGPNSHDPALAPGDPALLSPISVGPDNLIETQHMLPSTLSPQGLQRGSNTLHPGGHELSPHSLFSQRELGAHGGLACTRRRSDGPLSEQGAATMGPAALQPRPQFVSLPTSSASSPIDQDGTGAAAGAEAQPSRVPAQVRFARPRHAGTAGLPTSGPSHSGPVRAAILQLAAQPPAVPVAALGSRLASGTATDDSDATVHYPSRLLWGAGQLKSAAAPRAPSSLSEVMSVAARLQQVGQQHASPSFALLQAVQRPKEPASAPELSDPAVTHHSLPTSDRANVLANTSLTLAAAVTAGTLGVQDYTQPGPMSDGDAQETAASEPSAAAEPEATHGASVAQSVGGAGAGGTVGFNMFRWLDSQPAGLLSHQGSDMELGSFDGAAGVNMDVSFNAMGPFSPSAAARPAAAACGPVSGSLPMDISAPSSTRLDAGPYLLEDDAPAAVQREGAL